VGSILKKSSASRSGRHRSFRLLTLVQATPGAYPHADLQATLGAKAHVHVCKSIVGAVGAAAVAQRRPWICLGRLSSFLLRWLLGISWAATVLPFARLFSSPTACQTILCRVGRSREALATMTFAPAGASFLFSTVSGQHIRD
jgi:hypothetical protein